MAAAVDSFHYAAVSLAQLRPWIVVWHARAPPEREVLVASDSAIYHVGEPVIIDGPSDLVSWTPSVTPWAGVERTVSVTPGRPYVLLADVDAAPSGDLVYIGRWLPSEVTWLSGGSSGGVVEPASRPAWFPDGHAFIARAPSVRVLFYSERPRQDFAVNRVTVARLREVTP